MEEKPVHPARDGFSHTFVFVFSVVSANTHWREVGRS
jgi:hypothetical protein